MQADSTAAAGPGAVSPAPAASPTPDAAIGAGHTPKVGMMGPPTPQKGGKPAASKSLRQAAAGKRAAVRPEKLGSRPVLTPVEGHDIPPHKDKHNFFCTSCRVRTHADTQLARTWGSGTAVCGVLSVCDDVIATLHVCVCVCRMTVVLS